MSKSKAALEAERAKWGGLTALEANELYVANQSYGDQFYNLLARRKRLSALLPKFIAMGLWNEAEKMPTEAGLAIVRKVAGASIEYVEEQIARRGEQIQKRDSRRLLQPGETAVVGQDTPRGQSILWDAIFAVKGADSKRLLAYVDGEGLAKFFASCLNRQG